jgi:SAM-dependent methyltransferase
MTGPSYGVSDHYLDAKGRSYLAWQDTGGIENGRIEARKFAPLIRPEHVVLDFGCGAGNILRALTCARKIGVEVNPAARERCEQVGITCFADVAEVPDGIVDVAISNHALEHVPAPIEAMRQIRRTLKPGGWFCVCVPIDDWRVRRRFDPQDVNHHLYTWTIQLLGNALTEAGFSVSPDAIRLVNHTWPPKHLALEAALPRPVFKAICAFWAILVRRRELVAVVRAP